MTPSLYESYAALIEDLVRWIVRSRRLSDADAEDFASEARLKLLADDCAILRAYEGRSTMATYLSVVLSNHYFDWRRRNDAAHGGRWRPSVAARREGEVAVCLERMMFRDGLSFDEAVEMLRTNHGCTIDRDQLYAMSLRFPVRERRVTLGEEALEATAAAETADAILIASENETAGHRVAAILAREIETLAPQDRLVLKLLFEDNTSLTDVARALNVPYGRLYRRHRNILRQLNGALKDAGVGPGTVGDVSAAHAANQLERLLKKSARGPSLW